MLAYYNEIDPFAAAWLRELIKAGHIAPGDVDERDIRDVTPDDVAAYDQCHFFAGIGGWSYALRLADWSDDRRVWTGSCPCQPFSTAGKRKGIDDERHLWPAWFWLISQSRPGIIFGEQVASKDGLAWLDLVSADLEGAGYAVGALDLCAAGIGAPHIRQRLWFVADATGGRCHNATRFVKTTQNRQADTESFISGQYPQRPSRCSRIGSMAHTQYDGGRPNEQGREAERRIANWWASADWLPCRDGKARPIESGTFPLAHGIPGRVGRLRGYGNSIVPQVAAEFIKAYMETEWMPAR